MKDIIEEYRRTLQALEARHCQLLGEKEYFDDRIRTLEEEIDEVSEVLYWLRDYG